MGGKPRPNLSPKHCLRCGVASVVVDSRSTNGIVRRRRYCPVCGEHWTTYEIALELHEAVTLERTSEGLRRIGQAEIAARVIAEKLTQ